MPQSRRKEILHFHFKTLAMPQYKNLCLGGHKIYNFGRPFLDHHYYFLSLSDLCLGVEKMFFQEIIFTIWLRCPCPNKRIFARGYWNLQSRQTFLGHQNFTLSLSDLCLGVKKFLIFKKKKNKYCIFTI